MRYRRKRTAKEYEDEIEKTAKRFRKHPEALRSAKNSSEWLKFLDNLGIDMSSSSRKDFFDKVRGELRGNVASDIQDKLRREVKAETVTEKRNFPRQSRYSIAKYLGASTQEARRLRDVSEQRFAEHFNYSDYNQVLEQIYE